LIAIDYNFFNIGSLILTVLILNSEDCFLFSERIIDVYLKLNGYGDNKLGEFKLEFILRIDKVYINIISMEDKSNESGETKPKTSPPAKNTSIES